jgi:two-component system sensor histidine kinase VicK
MMITSVPHEGFPFGTNIHFVFGVKSGHFVFVHSSLKWILPDGAVNDASTLISKIEAEDILYLREVYQRVISGRYNGKITFKLRGPEDIVWLQAIPFSGEFQGEQVISGTVMEVTDEVANTQSIKKFADKKNSILHMLGHDLRGPLNIARSLIKTINREVQDARLLEKSGHIATILEQSIDMISDLVRREFLETINAELVKRRVDIVGKIAGYLEECRRSESLSGLSFHLRCSSEKIFIKLDDTKFIQVVNNLISNSLKFTPTGGSVSVSIDEDPDLVHFKFSDNGIGIPERLLPEIFEKFTPARRPGLQGEPTLGLGLSIVKTIVGWHDGNISCESKEGSGTTFFITLPKNLPG